MTARSDDPGVSPGTSAAAGGEIWGTWEELLLACAVRRHGTASWDSVAMEVQSRCPAAAAPRLTPTGCRLHFRLLHRRFAAGAGDVDEDPDAAAADGWVEELRKLRVAELRREVERYDLSIGSLQSKVKRLKEERERSISGEANLPAVKAEEGEEPAAGKGSLEDDAGGGEDRVSGGESGRSCKESNSSDLKRPVHDAGTASAAVDGAAAAKEEGEEEEAAAGESLAVKREEVSGESVARSKETDKESSDVQSSASPSRRREREGGGGAGVEEAEAEEASASTSARAALPAAEAEALLAFLESVRTSKPGSVFERRLESQDDAKYRSTIRRHVDLETVRSKLEGGGGACYSSASEFYRDLLLLCANALVFFPRGSPEHSAATRTRALVSKHIPASLRKDQPGTSGKAAAPASKKAKAEADVGSLLEKTAPIIVCRKRSSIAKAAAAAAKEEKAEKGETDKEENEASKKAGGTKDKARGLRTNKTRAAPVRKAAPNQKTEDNGSDSDAPAEGTKKPGKKGGSSAVGSGAGVAKKRNAVNFLNRMKQGSAPSTERVSLLETLKLSAAAEQKKAGKGSEGKKEPAGGSGSKRGRGTPPGRRNIGRPPKRAAAPPSPPPAKRARGGGTKRGGRK
ncbi:hypothetical protein SEVIR_6G213300v4 [Setaria viridis]|uniref:Bromo domain-containing protein n=1 Tax=Setaria viridis TaxID=4556 RepID=A0A4U6U944_SETVI|nr:uncharacterized protein LOC117860667 [Setaria viridis]TKW11125.1 hypothetical protein SEVIR_6G213300v2 [Setaria viridis]